jgi:hypothetical protein
VLAYLAAELVEADSAQRSAAQHFEEPSVELDDETVAMTVQPGSLMAAGRTVGHH